MATKTDTLGEPGPTQIGPSAWAAGGMEPLTVQVHGAWMISVCPTAARRFNAIKRGDFAI